METLVVLSEKNWHEDLFINLKRLHPEYNWIQIKERKEFNLSYLRSFCPVKIFIPHWSYVIPEEIFSEFECIVFHMTDLPYGRGGSPLQNLIIRGFTETKISALKVEKGIDSGPIYLKSPLSLHGTANEIFLNASHVIEQMIGRIIKEKPAPILQEGEPTIFQRRKPKDSNISDLRNLEQVYDYIRMLDAEGYPNAYVEFGGFRLEFSRVKKESNKSLLADVRIIKK